MATDIDEDLVSFVADTQYADIPDETIEYTKRLVLKGIAGTVVGSTEPSGRRAARFVSERSGTSDAAGVIACGFETSLPDATLANATFMHAPELEDDKIRENEDTAWTITALPVVLSLASEYRLSGKELIEASAVGIEVHTRLSIPPNKGLASDVIIQTAAIAGAAAAAKAMRLDHERTENALGLAISGGSIFIPNTGTDAHFFESAFQSVRGLEAARLAEQGATGNPDLETLFESLYGDETEPPRRVVQDIGETWELHGIGVKKYPCCFLTHKHIDALKDLIEEHDIDYEEVERVTLEIGVPDTVADDPSPTTTQEAQFSYQHHLAAMLLEGDVSFEQLATDTVCSERYREARSKIEVEVREDWTQIAPRAWLSVQLADGSEFSATRESYHGSPSDPLTESEFRALYEKFTAGILPPATVDRTAETVLSLEKSREVASLLDRLTFVS